MSKTYKMIDLCAGIGGIRRGYELAGGFKNVLSAEIDKNACLTYEHLYGDNPMNDITTEKFKAKVDKTEYDVLLAGFPCQAFSRAGKQAGFADKIRGTLFFDIVEIIRRTRPKSFMLENVDNLITHDKGHTFDTIIEVLVKDLHYKVIGVTTDNDGNLIYNRRNFVRNSRNFGVPQNRPRVYIMGFDREHFGGATDKLPNELPTERKTSIYTDLNDLLEMNADDKYFLSSGYVETLERHKARHEGKGNGFGYRIVNLPEIEHPVSNAILATGGSGKERNLVIDPKQGVAGKVIGSKQTPLNDRGIRTMTPREWGKLQGFVNYAFIDKKTGEDKFSFPEKLADGPRYKQFGNAVTIPAVEEMARFMKKCLAEIDKGEQLMVQSIKGKNLNKGEWAEFYVMLKLLGEGRLYTANKLLQKNYNSYLDILKIIRQEFETQVLEYIIDEPNGTVTVSDQVSHEVLATIPIQEFNDNASVLFNGIKSTKGSSIPAPDSVCDFAQVIYVSKPKAPAVKALKKQFGGKNDIFIEVRDGQTAIVSVMGFSIKSKFGQNPTLFNAGSSSQFVYRLSNCDDSIMKEFNDISDGEGRGWAKCKQFLSTKGISLEFVKTKNPIYNNNIFLIRESMSNILAWCVKDRLIDSPGSYEVMETTERMIAANPLGVPTPGAYYEKAIKDFLMAGFTGMTAAVAWDGKEQVNGGYIVVMDDGDVICYHSNDRESFRDYLYRNTHFEYVSAGKFAWSRIFKDGNDYYLPLNVSVRFNTKTR